MSIVTVTLQKRDMMGVLKTTQFTLIYVGSGSHMLALHKQQLWVG